MEELRKTTKSSARADGVLAEILIRDLQITKWECYLSDVSTLVSKWLVEM
jgi:hypothetical protein